MSITDDSRFISCDGTACQAAVAVPVGLRALLDPAPARTVDAVTDWLFVKTGEGWRHYCPRCAREYMAALVLERRTS